MDDLSAFLLARIAEDEDEVADCRHDDGQFGAYGKARGDFHEVGCYYYCHDLDPATCDCDGWRRRAAECEAKRRIVELHEPHQPTPDDGPICRICDGNGPNFYWPCDTLRALAMPYADHPSYRAEWAL